MSRMAKVYDRRKELGPPKPMALDPLPEQPLVSILISNYNYAAFLGDAIESCLRQTYDKLEIIICDDGSTDGSPRILERYRSLDTRVRVLYQANGGQSLAMNTALQKSTGDVICLLDADDVFMPDKVQRVIGSAYSRSRADSGFAVNRMGARVDDELGPASQETCPLLSASDIGFWMRPSLSLSAPHVA